MGIRHWNLLKTSEDRLRCHCPPIQWLRISFSCQNPAAFFLTRLRKMISLLAVVTRFAQSRARSRRVRRTPKRTLSLFWAQTWSRPTWRINFCCLLPPAQISFTVGFSMICSFGPIALIYSFEASDALAIEITFSSVGFSSLSTRSFTCRSRILSTNLSLTMSSTGDEYSQDFTLFFKRVTNWSTVSESLCVICQNWCLSKTTFFLGLLYCQTAEGLCSTCSSLRSAN